MSSLLLLFISFADAKPKKSKGPPPPPPVGWYAEEGWSGQCYAPPDFDKLLEMDRRAARQAALQAMKEQWSGQKDSGVQLSEKLVEDLETVMLTRAERIEGVSRVNHDLCVGLRRGTGSAEAWSSALAALPAKLTEGECPHAPMLYTRFDYLDIGKSWQGSFGVCKGDKVEILATIKDRYRIKDDGEWINVTGDPAAPAPTGADWPCNQGDCKVGQLVGKFTSVNGTVLLFPIGESTVFTASEHGTVTYSVNDTVWYDNRYFKNAAIEDHTAVTIQPSEP
jgi:hypothetical protein